MKPLAQFAENHPIVAGLVGASSGAAAKAMESLHLVAGIVADVGMIAGGVSACLSAAILFRRWNRERWERGAELRAIDGRERLERESGGDFLNYGAE